MVLLGALINAVEAAVGGLIGLVFKSHVSDDLGDFLLKGQGLCVVLVGVQGMASGGSIVVVTLAVALGSLVGYLIDLDGAVNRLGDWAQRRLNAAFAGSKRLGSFSQGFVNATLFCCTGAMAILIDLVVCIPFAATMGIGVPFVAVSVFVYQGVLSLLAAALGGLLTQAVITEIAVTGSLLLLAVGLNLLKLTDLKVANRLPAAFMPIALVPVMTVLGLL